MQVTESIQLRRGIRVGKVPVSLSITKSAFIDPCTWVFSKMYKSAR
jgi:hypothetical protein